MRGQPGFFDIDVMRFLGLGLGTEGIPPTPLTPPSVLKRRSPPGRGFFFAPLLSDGAISAARKLDVLDRWRSDPPWPSLHIRTGVDQDCEPAGTYQMPSRKSPLIKIR
jgi:hypothetical protein